MGSRQKSKLPIRKDSDKIVTNAAQSKQVINSKNDLSVGNNNTALSKHLKLQFQDPLTPLHRLRKFKKVRDRNLRKASLKKRFLESKKMSIDVEKDEKDTSVPIKEKKIVADKVNELTNGEKQHGEQNGHDSEGKEAKKAVENGEQITKSSKENEVDNQADEINEQLLNEQSEGKNAEIEKDENKGIEDISDEEVEVVKVDSEDEEETGSIDEDEVAVLEDKVKILSRSFREEVKRVSPFLSRPSTSKQEVMFKLYDSTPAGDNPFAYQCRVSGRRSLRTSRTQYKKRKLDDEDDDSEDAKKKRGSRSSPSILSPGWKFLSSPLTRFWTPNIPSETPYKDIPELSYLENNEDSMAVNVDDKSLYNKLNDSELGLTADDVSESSSSSSSSSSSVWRCNIM